MHRNSSHTDQELDEHLRPDDFVEPLAHIPGLLVDARYFGSDNFMGCRAEGYNAGIVLLTSAATRALAAVNAQMSDRGLQIKVFDGYRPQRAVDQFMRWASKPEDNLTRKVWHPNLHRSQLVPQGYLIPRSAHSRGSTVDLTLVDSLTGKELDMGTVFDFFDPASWPHSSLVTEKQQANRLLLQQVMISHGFMPIETEWWHFTLRDEPYPDTRFDFSVN